MRWLFFHIQQTKDLNHDLKLYGCWYLFIALQSARFDLQITLMQVIPLNSHPQDVGLFLSFPSPLQDQPGHNSHSVQLYCAVPELFTVSVDNQYIVAPSAVVATICCVTPAAPPSPATSGMSKSCFFAWTKRHYRKKCPL